MIDNYPRTEIVMKANLNEFCSKTHREIFLALIKSNLKAKCK